ncbi:hypothetical protein EYC84_002889 [Monilinia fructicola]|uniref:Uncharacterized protein n=1 Tax=Monilinia fructicola TaxID=38448 RepID=A0A5M9JUY4_MONFR|nr:hypothetical protein EYC84_002889 [Monilinia fructicola]
MIRFSRKSTKNIVGPVNFGSWTHAWENVEYIVYRARYECQPPFIGGGLLLQYTLAPPDEKGDVDHEAINSLCLAVGTWSHGLDGKTYVSDHQGWKMNKDIYEQPRKTLPNIDIPEHLKDDILLEARAAQARILID